MSLDTQFGAATESTYGTPVTVTRFWPLESEQIVDNVDKLESNSRRSGLIVQRSDISIPIYRDSTGTVAIPVMSKDLGFWLPHLLGGSVSTTGPTDSAYTHTASIGSLKGKSFTAQINRKFHDSGSDQAFTWAGGKVSDWQLDAAPGAEPLLTMTCDFQNVSTATGLASASYPTGLELMSWARANSVFTIGGVQVPITKFTLKCNNSLKQDRFYINGTNLKAEPVANAYRDIDWEVEADFSALTQYQRYNVATNAGQFAVVTLELEAPTLIGATTRPSVLLTLSAARFDKDDINNQGFDPTMQTIGGKARTDGSGNCLSIAYTTAQSTP